MSSWHRQLAMGIGLALILALLMEWPPDQTSVGPSQRPAQVADVNREVVKFCVDNLGKKVGDGQCGSLVTHAYRAVGAKPRSKLPAPTPPMRDDDYVWGRLLDPDNEAIRPGDIIQFRNLRLKVVYSNKSWRTWSYLHHTAVVNVVVGRNRYAIFHQNVGDKSKTPEETQVVQFGELDLNLKTEGTVWFYRPIPE